METGPTESITTPSGHRLTLSRRKGQGTPILFLNSIAADHRMWDGVRDRISCPSVAFDARGHGTSEVTPGRVLVADFAADARAVMDATGMERAIVCGLSLGGAVALQVAAERPDRVAGLVLANTATRFGGPARWEDRAATLRAGGLPDMVEPTLKRWLTQGWRQAHPAEAQQIASMVAAIPAEGYAAACAALADADMTGALSGWAGPTLIVAGRHDTSTPPAEAEAMQAIVPTSECVMLDTAHLSAVEDPGGFAAALLAFAGRVNGRGV